MQTNESAIINGSQKSNLQKRIYEKTKLIEMLQQKNSILYKEVDRISQMMKEISHKNEQKPNHEERKDIFMMTTNDPQILSKQLKNCYKRIKQYEYEVQKLKNKTIDLSPSQNLATMDAQFKQKKLIEDKLKQQLNSLLRQIAQNSKKLSGNNQQQQIQKEFKSKVDELRFLKQMIKDYDSKDAIKQKNLKIEYNHIKKVQTQFAQNGGSLNELETIKQKAVSQFQEGRRVRQNPKDKEEMQDLRINKLSSKSISNNSHLSQNGMSTNPEAEAIQDRTITHYQSLLNELQVLEKLNKKYEKQLEESDKNLKIVSDKTQLTSLRVERLEIQIQEMNGSIKERKTCIVAENMKPTHRKSVRSVNPREDSLNISEARQNNKRKRNIINMTAILSDREQRLYNN